MARERMVADKRASRPAIAATFRTKIVAIVTFVSLLSLTGLWFRHCCPVCRSGHLPDQNLGEA